MQVQATALQVLKSLVQRYNNTEEKSFVIFFVGELIGDIVSLMQRALLVVFSFLPSIINRKLKFFFYVKTLW